MKQIKIFVISILCLLSYVLCFFPSVLAGPQSTTYEIKEFGFGAGGLESTDSTNYSLFGTAGETESGKNNSSTYSSGQGLIFTIVSNVPPAPTFTNPGNNYDRLKFVILTGNNPSDSLFAIAITDDNWITTKYIKNDYTVGTTLASSDWLKYDNGGSGDWGGASGRYVTGLTNSTTYKIKVKVKQGNFTESAWGPESSATTNDPSLSFGIDSASLNFDNLNSGNNYTDSTKSTVLTTSTNAYNGYIVYGHNTGPLTFDLLTITDYASANSSPTTWSGTGFGYTTNDNNLSGGTADRFTNGGPKYAGFGQSAPGDPVADHTGTILTPISNEEFTVSYRVTTLATTIAGNYKTTVLYVVVPTY